MIQFESNDLVILDKKSGDRKRTQRTLDYETNLAQGHLDPLRSEMIVPTTQDMFNRYQAGADQAFSSYGDIMGRYQGFLDDPRNQITADQVKAERIDPYSIGYSRTGELDKTLRGYGEFADTGGFDEGARADIRARGISPIRAAYGNTMQELNRARALGGEGGSANYIAAASRAQRELPQQLSDATQNVNAQLAHMIQQGRLSGLGGLSQASQADIGFGQQAQLANQEAAMRARLANQGTGLQAGLANQQANLAAQQGNIGARLGGLSGMSSLYSASPGLASTFGNQVLGSTGNWLNAQQLQQQKMNARIQGQIAHAGIPTGFRSFLDNARRIGDIGTNIANIPWGGGGGGGGA